MANHDLVDLLENDPSRLTNAELLFLDYTVHVAWRDKCQGLKQFHFQLCSLGYLIGIHTLVRQEMDTRSLRHLISDELETRTSTLAPKPRTVQVGFDGRVEDVPEPETGSE